MSIMDMLRAWMCPKCVQPIEPPFNQQVSIDRISSLDVVELFASAGGIEIDGNDLHITDRTFKLVDINHVTEFLKANPVSSRQYVKERHDCDDFSYLLLGDVTWWDSDLAFGIIHGRTSEGGGHAWNVCIGTDREIWFIEPQNDMIWKPSNLWEIWLVVM